MIRRSISKCPTAELNIRAAGHYMPCYGASRGLLQDTRMSGELRSVITGASSGIGRAIAIAIASKGGFVCLVGRDQERLEAVARSAARRSFSAGAHC